jgi:iron complex outermembrane recepter protein
MKNHAMVASRPVRRSLLSSAVLAALAATSAQAQDAAPAPAAAASAPAPTPAPAPKPEVEKLDAVIVTGTARSEGLKKLDAGFSITTASDEQIKEAAPSSSADLLKIVPGVMVETTGGNSGANIQIRGFAATGDAPWVSFQLNGSTLYPPPTLSFLENSSLFRLDDTIDRVEVLRGGPSPIFSNGQPGATVNFLQKKGGSVSEGGLRVTAGSGDLRRVDGVYSGKIADGWYGSFGGFYRTAQGIRDTQFPADRGGQFSAMLTRKLDEGELNVYGRWLNDKNTFYLPIPLLAGADGKKLSSFPGFPAQNATFIGNELRQVEFQAFPGSPPGTVKIDMADGRGADVHLYGATLDKRLGGWQLSNKMNYLSGTMPTYAWFTGANPQSVDEFIAAQNATHGGTGGTASYVNGGGAVPGSQQVLSVGAWSVVKNLKSFTNDFRLSRDLTPDNTLTVGAYFADYSSDDTWHLGNNFLTTLEQNGRLVDVALTGSPAVITRNGQLSGSFFSLKAHYKGQNTALFVADEWRPTDALRLDAGVRWERQRVAGTTSNATATDLDGDPNTIYNNGVSVVNGTVNSLNQTDRHTAWTAGANYYLTKDLSVFGRINSGFQFPQFDALRSNQPQTTVIKQYELGLKTVTPLYSAFLTAFYNTFEGLSFQQILANGTTVNSIGGSDAKGLEAELAVRPLKGLELALSGNVLDAKYKDFGANSGHRVQRQPKVQFRFTPSYRFDTALGSVKVYATYSHVGERFADQENAQVLPRYHTIDAGLVAHLHNGIDVRLTGTNLTNEIGITEGNTRVLGGATTNGVFMGRPIFGRAAELSVGFAF